MPNPCSIRLAISLQYRLVTDVQTDGQTEGHTAAYIELAQRRTVKSEQWGERDKA